ncbi:metal-dependent hydrolase [Halopenitus persicus]|uniref:Inner membrane protein n=1 Tax=Halopenitus persicus TaxID=1048396 RepID=A0A1H3HM82_9EURY|nr:metal-dependent hydrolase [Halopenitus persicus]SDY15908.1 inner membrane protein [Halopenitus persicus]
MYRIGHLGASIAVYAPFGAGLIAVGADALAVFAGAVMMWFTMLPDVDHRLPVVPHRGPTHSLAFAALVGVGFGAAGSLAASELGVTAAVGLGAFGLVLGVATVGAHLLADALTPAGVPLFWPISRRTYSLSLWRADNTMANYGLFVGGLAVAVGAFALVGRLVGW